MVYKKWNLSYKKREQLEIISQILNVMLDTPQKKTGISYQARLDNRLTSQYLRLMQDVELVKKTEYDESLFILTEKGLEFRKRLDEIIGMLDLPDNSLIYQIE